MDERMKWFAENGDINAFYQLIREDEKLLEHIDELTFADTPLHIAASTGQIPFAIEMMGLKPSFARKLNQNGFSPIHLALQNGHIELVRRLLQIDGDLVCVKGRERLTPLHHIVESGNHLDLLEEFLLVCPDSIVDVTGRNETALHIALKYNRLEAVKHLLAWGYKFVDVNHKNLEDETAWDILQGKTKVENGEIRDMLRRAKAKSGSSLSTSNRYAKYQRLPVSSCFQFLKTDFKREIRKLSEERRSLLLVVAVLLVTVSYQAVLSPPGGLWQDNGQCNTTEVGSSPDGTIDLSNTIIPTKAGFFDPNTDNKTPSNTTAVCEHKAGTAIAFEDGLFQVFLICNAITFLISNSLIIFLVPNGYMKVLFFALNVTLCFSYSYALLAIAGDPYKAYTAGSKLVEFSGFGKNQAKWFTDSIMGEEMTE
ncbi:ankyrin repeat-containing protein bda1 [Quercus suber]|uniref:Ankyrin repeat-containing protein bda1 n=1 Tax=Quercus suber TaxID=58331 RepID=A0AAW0LR25_QUESU